MKRHLYVLSSVVGFSALAAYSGFAQITPSTPSKAVVAVSPADLKWEEAPPGLPKGATATILYGNPEAAGTFVIRAKMPSGYLVPPHWHSTDEHVTVMEGSMAITDGSTVDRASSSFVPIGGHFFVPAGHRHYAIAGDQGATIQIAATGPFDINYVNPKDDPRSGGGQQ